VTDFDAGSLGMKFDYILAHSILSHAAHRQLGQFLENSAKVLAPSGKIVASIRLAEGNKWGSAGSPDKDDSRCAEWQYPGVSFFKKSTVLDAAEACGLEATHKPEYTEFYVNRRPEEHHDWFVFKKGKGWHIPSPSVRAAADSIRKLLGFLGGSFPLR